MENHGKIMEFDSRKPLGTLMVSLGKNTDQEGMTREGCNALILEAQLLSPLPL